MRRKPESTLGASEKKKKKEDLYVCDVKLTRSRCIFGTWSMWTNVANSSTPGFGHRNYRCGYLMSCPRIFVAECFMFRVNGVTRRWNHEYGTRCCTELTLRLGVTHNIRKTIPLDVPEEPSTAWRYVRDPSLTLPRVWIICLFLYLQLCHKCHHRRLQVCLTAG